jgi:hypothetical protein
MQSFSNGRQTCLGVYSSIKQAQKEIRIEKLSLQIGCNGDMFNIKPSEDGQLTETCKGSIYNFFFICIVGGGIKVHSTLRPLNGLLYQPRVIMIMEKSVE